MNCCARLMMMTLAALTLSACGGGGGGGGGGSAAITPVAVVTPIPFQAAATTATYPVDSVSATLASNSFTASRVDAAGAGSTLTLTTDAAGNFSQIAFNVLTPGANYSSAYTTANAASSTASEILVSDSSSRAGAFVTGLSYSTYGLWAISDSAGAGRVGVFATGAQTLAGAMPSNGSATYNGVTGGYLTDTNGVWALTGNIQLIANFTNASVTSTISGISEQNTTTGNTATMPNITGTSTITGNHYSGTTSGTTSGGAASGTIIGTFYGPTANETAGVWRLTGSGVTAFGSYGAKQ